MATLKATFEVERETKNTIRFAEVEGSQPPIIGTLYVQKWAVRKLKDLKDGEVKTVTVTVEAE